MWAKETKRVFADQAALRAAMNRLEIIPGYPAIVFAVYILYNLRGSGDYKGSIMAAGKSVP